ncbi:MAG TPA: ABC transporter permease [Cyclobacteriaceae bacterium]|jgi:putative ABC transport system permease protein|nr:MAG: ABC transporter permease [Bacteroidota bacterium]
MLRNYIKVAMRNLQRHKGFSFINIFGLAIGMACSILILLWVRDELSYDRFHTNADHTYRIIASLPEFDLHAAISSAPIAQAVRTQIPGVKNAVRLRGFNKGLFQVGDRMFEEEGLLFADSTFFDVFSFPLVAGNPKTALRNPDGIVITESAARKYFGDEPALGQTIVKNHKEDLVVTGVVADAPGNSHIRFDFVQPMTNRARTDRDLKENVWDNFNFATYLLLDESVDTSPEGLKRMGDQIQAIYKENEPVLKVAFALQPLKDAYLHSSYLMADQFARGNVQYVYILTIIAVIILAVACINFMNLATARSARRAKEVGLRKVAGAVRSQIIRQFLAESAVVALLALLLAIVLVVVALPPFNALTEKSLKFDFTDGKMLTWLLIITAATGLVSGSYPALFLSGFLPSKVLKGNLRAGAAGSTFRNTLVVVQFAISIILLVGTGVVYNQLQFIQERNLGFDKENLVYAPMNGDLWSKYRTLRNELERNPFTSRFTIVSDLPTNLVNGTVNAEWERKSPDTQPLFTSLAVDENFADVFGVSIVEGRWFSKDFTADSANFIVNESTLKIMGMDAETAVGQPLMFQDVKGKIIGVVKDFNFQPLQQPIGPLVMGMNRWGGTVVVRTQPGQTDASIDALGDIWEELNPAYPFSYDFVDQSLASLYRAEQRLGTLFNVFSGLAILISCLGLYGLSAFLAERRTKEIGLRKALGASVPSVVYLLSRSFTKPVFIAMVVACPLAWYSMNRWLAGFAYHVQVDWTVFIFAFLVALIIAWVTVSVETFKAARINPAESLRNE